MDFEDFQDTSPCTNFEGFFHLICYWLPANKGCLKFDDKNVPADVFNWLKKIVAARVVQVNCFKRFNIPREIVQVKKLR